MTFWWVNSLISFGKKNTLKESNTWPLNDEFVTKTIYGRFLQQYSKDSRKFRQAKADERRKFLKKKLELEELELDGGPSKPIRDINILWPFLRTFKFELCYAAIFKLISVLFGFAQPFLLDLIMAYIRSDDPVAWKGYCFALCMLASSAVESLLGNRYEIYINQLSLKLKSALTLTIYKKSLILSSSGKKVGLG